MKCYLASLQLLQLEIPVHVTSNGTTTTDILEFDAQDNAAQFISLVSTILQWNQMIGKQEGVALHSLASSWSVQPCTEQSNVPDYLLVCHKHTSNE